MEPAQMQASSTSLADEGTWKVEPRKFEQRENLSGEKTLREIGPLNIKNNK